MNDTNRLSWLFQRYYTQTATGEEQAELIALLELEENNETIASQLKQQWEQLQQTETDALFTKDKGDLLLYKILAVPQRVVPLPASRSKTWRWYAAAAVVVLLVSGYWLMQGKRSDNNGLAVTAAPIEPGGNKATLTLGDGSQIELNDAKNGVLSKQGSTNVEKTGTGQLAYTGNNQKDNVPVAYNILRTPAGGQFHVQLPDGTQVWLNAASSLRYPTAFTGSNRMVTLTGEGYFEVAPQAKQPFIVQLQNSSITVLGTHFNVNDYTDEPATRTTLLEGAVQVNTTGAKVWLQPGLQAVQGRGSDQLSSAATDAALAVAWKNGLFQFDHADIGAIARQISRWYQVSVRFEGSMPVKKLSGKIARNASLQEVMQMLGYAGIHCRLDNTTLIILPS